MRGRAGYKRCRPRKGGDDMGWTVGPSHVRCSLRRHVFSVLYREQDAGAVVEAVAVLFGEVVDALAGSEFLLAHQRLTDCFAEFRRTGLGRLQRHRHDAFEDLEGVVGMARELAAAVGAVLAFIGGVKRKARLLGEGGIGFGFPVYYPPPPQDG